MVGRVVGHHPDIPEGRYIVKYAGYETGHFWCSPKVILKFKILDGEWSTFPLSRYYNAIRIFDPIGPDGGFEVGDRSYLLKEFRLLFPEILTTDKVDLNVYRGKRILVDVETTNKTGTGEILTESNQYSVIRKLIEIVPESFE